MFLRWLGLDLELTVRRQLSELVRSYLDSISAILEPVDEHLRCAHEVSLLRGSDDVLDWRLIFAKHFRILGHFE